MIGKDAAPRGEAGCRPLLAAASLVAQLSLAAVNVPPAGNSGQAECAGNGGLDALIHEMRPQRLIQADTC
jgi:hypothetical protein